MPITADTTASTTEICSLAGFTKQRLHALERDGGVSRSGRDQWPLAETIRRLFTYSRDESRRARSTEAAVRLTDAKAKAVELRTQRETHELIPTEEALATVDAIVGGLVSALNGVPSRCTRDLEMRRVIEREINAARASAALECQRRAQALRSTGKATVFR